VNGRPFGIRMIIRNQIAKDINRKKLRDNQEIIKSFYTNNRIIMAKTILIVDDSESIREIVSFTLENEGYKVLIGVDGKDALKFLNNGPIDLIITDLHMPVMNGIEFIKSVRASTNHKGVPILFLTTESQTDKKMEAKEAGATGWIIKPFVPAKLLEAINKVIR
jgi:two-component system, chemotaxis family, chemotaxis protein CheY